MGRPTSTLTLQEVSSVEELEAGGEGSAGEGVSHRLGEAELLERPPA